MAYTKFQLSLLEKVERMQEVCGAQTLYRIHYSRETSPLWPRGYHPVKHIDVHFSYGQLPLGAETTCLAAASAIWDIPLEKCEVKKLSARDIRVTFN